MTNKTLLTKDGYKKLSQELLDLEAKRDHLITQIEEVAQPDESGEDSLASQLKDELELINDKITELEETLEVSKVIDGDAPKTGLVQIGSKVKVKIAGKTEKEFDIVSELESDPTQNKISDNSPIGKALIGKKVNEEIIIDAPVGKITYKIVSIK
jgi:transcription elongation factor GreA